MKKLSSIIIYLYKRFSRLRVVLPFFLFSAMFFIISAAVFISKNVITSPVGWEKQSFISPAGVPAKNINAQKRGNLLACVFEGNKSGYSSIYLAVSFNGGTDFVKTRKIVQFKSDISNNPRIAIDRNGKFYLCWYQLSSDGSSGKIFISTSKDYGVTWEKARNISFNLQMEILPSVYCDGKNRIHLFFTAMKGKAFNLFHSVMDENESFGDLEKITELKGGIRGAFSPSVKFHENHAVVIWQSKEKDFQDHLYYVKSSDYGDSWSGIDKITTGKFNNQAPSFIIYEDTIYLVYMNNSKKNWGIKMLRGSNYGTRWDDPVEVSLTNANCYSPDIIFLPGKQLVVTWHDSRDKGNRIYYRKYSTVTRKFDDEKKLSFKERPGRSPVTLKSGDKVVVLWEESGRIVVNRSDTTVVSPLIYSKTHSQGRWTRERDAVIKWKKPRDESGIAGYATLVDNKPDTAPTIQNFRYDRSETVINGLNDGITYFHIRAIDGAGNMSRTIHYKLLVSSNPLSMPVIISPTHVEGKNNKRRNARFRWAVNDSRRLKGFLYSLSKDKYVVPNKFLSDFTMSFPGLENGVYFFNLAAVSKTNQISRVTTYSFIVGAEGSLDPEYLKRIAKRKDVFKEKEIVKAPRPTVKIVIPDLEEGKIESNSFDLYLEVNDISKKQVSGYSLVTGNKKTDVPRRMGSEKSVFEFDKMNQGKYVIGARARYFLIDKGRKVYKWTAPVYADVEVTVPLFVNPFESVYARLLKRIDEKVLFIMGFVTLFLSAPIFAGSGGRFVFFFKNLRHKLNL